MCWNIASRDKLDSVAFPQGNKDHKEQFSDFAKNVEWTEPLNKQVLKLKLSGYF